ncbi:hypothetical protein SAMN05216188_1463 [Lentzea xinjiangensis]|uniref:Uncharacterized protein n=1 Tax=Lentzea xinjiangensis TaxID=402600 RepID=A0A1H9WVA5_9PSEU|nr:hypothetical protein [Lentzea xinjiangensis]SES37858.1 hypothetical protein SAMN05216188_1463 [Lentzea xinjiangensis]
MTIPTTVVLVGLALALLAVIVLWKLLLIGGGILTAQWLMFTAAADNPALQLAVLAIPALVVAAVITHRTPTYRHRPAPAGFGSRSRAAEEATR